MKHGKSPTVKQKKLIESRRLNSSDWLVERDTTEKMVIVSRCGKRKRNIYKEV